MDQERIEKLAKSAAWCVVRGDVAIENADWWVGEYSYKLGIVDGHGMIDMQHAHANSFRKAFKKELNK